MVNRKNSDAKAENAFKVPARQWKKWTLVGRHVFNKTFETMRDNQSLFLHTELQDQKMPDKLWRTTAWNAAWISADICSRGERHLLKDLETRVKG